MQSVWTTGRDTCKHTELTHSGRFINADVTWNVFIQYKYSSIFFRFIWFDILRNMPIWFVTGENKLYILQTKQVIYMLIINVQSCIEPSYCFPLFIVTVQSWANHRQAVLWYLLYRYYNTIVLLVSLLSKNKWLSFVKMKSTNPKIFCQLLADVLKFKTDDIA